MSDSKPWPPPRPSGGALIAPSLLAADFAQLGAEADSVAAAGADWLHLDIMDGHFVPNISFGFPIVESIRAATALPLDVHLMIVEPERYAEQFVRAGADAVIVHVETCGHLHGVVQAISASGAIAAVALNPVTPLESIFDVLPFVGEVLVMSVNPGFGGQSFLDLCLPKIRTARALMDKHGLESWLQVDGGVSLETIERCAEAGADVFVAGSAVFSADDPDAMVAALRAKAEGVGSQSL